MLRVRLAVTDSHVVSDVMLLNIVTKRPSPGQLQLSKLRSHWRISDAGRQRAVSSAATLLLKL